MTDVGVATLAKELAAVLDAGADQPLSSQIVDRIWLDVIEGAIETGQRLPTVRQLSVHLGLNPKTLERAYGQLERLGIVSTRPGEGTFVRLNVPDDDARKRRQELEQCGLDAVACAESLGLSVEDLMDTLDDIRNAKHSHSPDRSEP